MIEKLTAEQEEKLKEWRVICDDMVLSTEPADRQKAEKAIKRIYKFLKKGEPEIIWTLSPKAQKEKAEELFPDLVEVAEYLAGKHDSYYIGFRKFFTDVLEYDIKENQELLDAMWDLAQSCMWVIQLEGVAILCEREEELHLDDRNLLHNEDGAAMLFRDGTGIYSWHGVRVPKHVIVDPGAITAEEIKNEPNMEVRQVMMLRFGWDRWVDEVGAKLIHECPDPTNMRLVKDPLWMQFFKKVTGDKKVVYEEVDENIPKLQLYEFDDDGITIRIVKCINGTPEPDGTFKTYGIRVKLDLEFDHLDNDNALHCIISTYPRIAAMPNAVKHYSGMVRT